MLSREEDFNKRSKQLAESEFQRAMRAVQRATLAVEVATQNANESNIPAFTRRNREQILQQELNKLQEAKRALDFLNRNPTEVRPPEEVEKKEKSIPVTEKETIKEGKQEISTSRENPEQKKRKEDIDKILSGAPSKEEIIKKRREEKFKGYQEEFKKSVARREAAEAPKKEAERLREGEETFDSLVNKRVDEERLKDPNNWNNESYKKFLPIAQKEVRESLGERAPFLEGLEKKEELKRQREREYQLKHQQELETYKTREEEKKEATNMEARRRNEEAISKIDPNELRRQLIGSPGTIIDYPDYSSQYPTNLLNRPYRYFPPLPTNRQEAEANTRIMRARNNRYIASMNHPYGITSEDLEKYENFMSQFNPATAGKPQVYNRGYREEVSPSGQVNQIPIRVEYTPEDNFQKPKLIPPNSPLPINTEGNPDIRFSPDTIVTNNNYAAPVLSGELNPDWEGLQRFGFNYQQPPQQSNIANPVMEAQRRLSEMTNPVIQYNIQGGNNMNNLVPGLMRQMAEIQNNQKTKYIPVKKPVPIHQRILKYFNPTTFSPEQYPGEEE